MRALVTLATGSHLELLEIALPSLHEFADRHGYDVIVADVDSRRPPSWRKVPALREALAEYEEALWLDADIVIVDPSDDLDVPEHCSQALVRHHTGDGEVPNCGVWFVRRPMIPILDEIWSMTEFYDHGWWEQAAMLTLLGYRVDPRPTELVTTEPTGLYRRTHWLDNSWNCHRWDLPQPQHVRFQHATMWPERDEVMRSWAAQAAKHEENTCAS